MRKCVATHSLTQRFCHLMRCSSSEPVLTEVSSSELVLTKVLSSELVLTKVLSLEPALTGMLSLELVHVDQGVVIGAGVD